jgi:pilus assembly protein CpaB
MRRTLLAITAVLLATIGTTLLYIYVSTADHRAQQRVTTVRVLVAGGDAEPGTAAASLRVEARDVPAFGAVPRAISGLNAVMGKVLTVRVFAGQQLSDRMFGPAGSVGLAPGHRAVSVQFEEADRVSSLLRAGSRVDVFRLEKSAAIPVLSEAPVLSADAKGIVTFDLDDAGAKALLGAAASHGRLALTVVG